MSAKPDRTSGGEIVRRAGVVATGTLSSRILGAVRDAVVAAVFALGATDAFWLAFTIPNALRVLLGEGAVSAAFVPVFTEVREREGMARAKEFYRNLIGAMAVVLLVVTLFGIVGAPWIVKGYAWGFQRDEALFATTVALTRLLFPYIFLMGISALMMGALYASKRFAAPAFAPALLNISLIAGALLLAPLFLQFGWPAIFALAVGALLGGALQIVAQLPSLRKENLIVRPRIGFSDIYVRKCARLMVPLLAGLGVYQLNVLLSRLFASFLPTGSVSYLYYGQRLAEIPQGMFALAIASAALPSLSDAVAKGDEEEAKRLFRHALRLSPRPSTFLVRRGAGDGRPGRARGAGDDHVLWTRPVRLSRRPPDHPLIGVAGRRHLGGRVGAHDRSHVPRAQRHSNPGHRERVQSRGLRHPQSPPDGADAARWPRRSNHRGRDRPARRAALAPSAEVRGSRDGRGYGERLSCPRSQRSNGWGRLAGRRARRVGRRRQ
jgi:hypothetical protein